MVSLLSTYATISHPVLTTILNNLSLLGLDPIELTASALGIAYIILQYRANAWMWIVSLVMSLLYIYVNYANHLPANALLQAVFAVMAVVGLLRWGGLMRAEEQTITSLPRSHLPYLLLATLALAVITYAVLHLTGESQMPVFDSITMAINLTGTYMLIRRYYQEWLCWLIVDPLMAAMYAVAGLWPSAILYTLFSIVVVFGYRNWRRMAKEL